jgi:hypothetical protein
LFVCCFVSLFLLRIGNLGKKSPGIKTAHLKKIQSSDGFWEKKQPQSGKRLQISTLQCLLTKVILYKFTIFILCSSKGLENFPFWLRKNSNCNIFKVNFTLYTLDTNGFDISDFHLYIAKVSPSPFGWWNREQSHPSHWPLCFHLPTTRFNIMF